MRINCWLAAGPLLLGTFVAGGLGQEKKGGDAGDVGERLKAAETAFREIMSVPETSIPVDLLQRAECVVLVPGLKKGAFVVGAEYGKGFITCRKAGTRNWSAPGNIRVEGGSVGFQIGGGETDLFLLVMNETGANKLLESQFKIGGEAAVMGGPVGREVQANTDAFMRAEMLGYSRSRGVFAGVALEGTTLREDRGENQELYGRDLSNQQIVRGDVATPPAAASLVGLLSTYSPREK
jgi:lipid-binding SYLF domain-containing protein